MSMLTIHGIDSELSQRLKLAAKEQGLSVNSYILQLLKISLGLSKPQNYTKKFHDLDHLFGTWTDEECAAISKKIIQERQIDDELWK